MANARDGDGIALRDALLAFGGDPDAVAALARRREDVVGYLEVHIEQGPLLESKDLAVGIVSAIAGITRARALVKGEAGMPAPCRWRCAATRSRRRPR